MSLQEIEKYRQTEGTMGMEKEIDSSSQKMVMDILQATQYTKPIESTVRELASNAVDSQREKEIAYDILSNGANPDDYFVNREGAQFESSKWDPSYFDTEYFNMSETDVYIRYKENPGTGFCDEFSVTDHGVGLGMPRLRGYFSLGYSTKRNTKHALGAYGLGAKSALSTSVPFFTLETAHNGRIYKFNVYPYKIESLIPRFNMETEEEYPSQNIGTEDKPYIVHYIPTDGKNYTTVTTGVKRHNRHRFKDAVKHQLLYFPNARFFYTNEGNDYENEIDFKAKILHNSESLLISSNSQYRNPHIVVVKEQGSDTGVTYGTIDFQELEMETLRGSIGFKCPIRSVVDNPETGEREVIQDGITVTPNREAVVWDENTRKYIQKVIKDAQQEASNIIQDELQTDDFYNWIQRSNEIIAQMDAFSYNESKLTILAKIVDKNKLETKFPGDKRIVYKHNPSTFFKDIEVKAIKKERVYKGGRYKTKVERDEVPTWGYFKGNLIYEMTDEDRHAVTKDLYLQHINDSNHFITVKKGTDEQIKDRVEKRFKSTQLAQNNPAKLQKRIKEEIDEAKRQRDIIWNALFSSDHITIEKYGDVEVTDEFKELMKAEKEEAEEAEQEDKMANLTPAERRELLGKTVCNSFRQNPRAYRYSVDKNWILSKKEPVLKDLKAFDKTVVYGVSEDDEKLKALCAFYAPTVDDMLNGSRRYVDLWDLERINQTPNYKGVSILRFSKRNVKHIKNKDNFIHVDDFTMQQTEDTYNLGEPFARYFTGQKIADRLEKIKFLRNFSQIDEGVQKAYLFLYNYKQDNFYKYDSHYVRTSDLFKELSKSASNAYQFQKFLRESDPTEEQVKDKARLLFNNEDITKVHGLDIDVLELMDEIEAYAEPIKDLMSSIDELQEGKGELSNTAINQLQTVIKAEGLDQYKLSEDKQKLIQQDEKEEDDSNI